MVMQLSMKSELVGTQTLLFVNSVLRRDKVEGVVAPVMMQRNGRKVEIREIGEDVVDSR